MRGLLLLIDPRCAYMRPESIFEDRSLENIMIQTETAASDDPPLLSALQMHIYRLKRCCDWICVMAEGNMTAYGLALAAQLPVDRLILIGDHAFRRRNPDRRARRINAFARRNLSLITAEIVAAGMRPSANRKLSRGLGYHHGGLICLRDAAELWQKRESFLTAPFHRLSEV